MFTRKAPSTTVTIETPNTLRARQFQEKLLSRDGPTCELLKVYSPFIRPI